MCQKGALGPAEAPNFSFEGRLGGRTCVCVCLYACVCVFVCMYVCVCVCVVEVE